VVSRQIKKIQKIVNNIHSFTFRTDTVLWFPMGSVASSEFMENRSFSSLSIIAVMSVILRKEDGFVQRKALFCAKENTVLCKGKQCFALFF
jgi:hypothetical protein